MNIILLSLTFLFGFGQGEPDIIQLTDDNFAEKISEGNWFIEFYVPWCKHCKALEPTWKATAVALDGIANVGSVDCTTDKDPCKANHVTGYPTIKLKIDKTPVLFDYKDFRNEETLIKFGKKMASPTISKYEKKKVADGNVFIAVYSDEDTLLHENYEHIAKMNKLDATFYKANDIESLKMYDVEKSPALVSVKEGLVHHLFNGDFSEESLLNFVKSHKLPLLPELGKGGMAGAKAIYEVQKPFVLLVIDGKDKNAEKMKNSAKEVAVEMNTDSYSGELKDKYQFIWIDGVEYSTLVTTNFNLGPQLPQILIWDQVQNFYWLEENPKHGRIIDSTVIKQFISDVKNGKIEKEGGYLDEWRRSIEVSWYQLKIAMYTNPMVPIIMITFPIFILAITCSYKNQNEDEDDKGESVVGKDGLKDMNSTGDKKEKSKKGKRKKEKDE